MGSLGVSRHHFGAIPGIAEGRLFANRSELAAAKVHRPRMHGISGSGDSGAESIVISGGYEDDRDFGDVILYTGEGGRDSTTGRQVADQPMSRGNLALARSADEGLSVRVIRGARLDSEHAPAAGYRYDGIYRVEQYWHERGSSGFLVWRYLLRKDRSEPMTADDGMTTRMAATIQRIVRNTAMSQLVKVLHKHHCQVCGIRLETRIGPYAEAAHIRPLGMPHDGPDLEENILCLCPNHHVLFDRGVITISDDLALVEIDGTLRLAPGHKISLDHLAYHREHWGNSS